MQATNANGAVSVNQAYVAPDGQVDGFLDIVSSDIEQCFVIQATTDFKTWVNVQTTTGMGNLLEFNDPGAAAYQYRFYRPVPCEP